MPTIDELANKPKDVPEFTEAIEPEVIEQSSRGIDFSVLKTQTGDGEINDYINHPLNFNQSRGMAQIIRGVTGFAGEMRYAIIDIVLGAMHYSKERKGALGNGGFDRGNSLS